MKNSLLELKILLEKAKTKYHQDFVDIKTWKSIISYLLGKENIKNKITDGQFPDYVSDMVYKTLDKLPTLEGISEENLVKLTDLLTEIFDLLTVNENVDKVVEDLESMLTFLNKVEKDILPPEEQTSIENPEGEKEELVVDDTVPIEGEEPAPEEGGEEVPAEGEEELPPEEEPVVDDTVPVEGEEELPPEEEEI